MRRVIALLLVMGTLAGSLAACDSTGSVAGGGSENRQGFFSRIGLKF
jgi:hypothetical protein